MQKEEKKKLTIGYLFCERKYGKDEQAFSKVCKKRKINLVMFNIYHDIEQRELEKKAAKCDIIFNNSADEYAIEYVKTLEELGKKVIDSSRSFYYIEDKWMFYLMCRKNKIPTPKTILLPENLIIARKKLKKFNKWPVILKRIEGCQGEFVERAENLDEAIKIIQNFWKKGGGEKLPIIAQQFIKSKSYRVTLIGGKIVQTATKDANGWKSTGVYQKVHHKFKVGSRLRKIAKKVALASRIHVLGIDFMKKGEKWFVLEANAVPAFDFFPNEREKLLSKVIDLLVKEILLIKT
jgi:glutathione synthase/RimK-type ligase-like ATP-grasp enzyme